MLVDFLIYYLPYYYSLVFLFIIFIPFTIEE